MKHAKMLGLMAVAALAVMAFVGVSSASAKVCSTAGLGASCGAGHGNELTTQGVTLLSEGHATKAREVKLTSGFITVSCDSHIEVTVTHEVIDLTSLTFTNCTSSLGECTSASANATKAAPYAVTTAATGGGNGTMTVKASPITGQFTCAGITCKYTTPEAGGANGSLTVTGSDTAPKVVAAGISLTKEEGSSGFCSSTATWEGPYTMTSPTSGWIT
jgi:hypothetical protein